MTNFVDAIKQQMHGYTIKKMESMQGHDGLAWRATFCKDGKEVVTAYDDGWGGPVALTVHDKELYAGFVAKAKELEPEGFEVEGALAGMIADAAENLKAITRKAKSAVLVQLVGDTQDEYRVVKMLPTLENIHKVKAHYGDKLQCVINEQLG